MSEKIEIVRHQAEQVVVQVNAGASKHNIFQISFLESDGSIMVHLPYGPDVEGLLSVATIRAGEKELVTSLEEQGRWTTHKVKYSHHPSGQAHFSQTDKINTEVKRASVPLDRAEGHIFSLQVAGLNDFRPATRKKDVSEPSEKRVNLIFDLGERLPPAVKFVGDLYSEAALQSRLKGTAAPPIGPLVPIAVGDAQTQAFCIGNPCAALADRLLLIRCEIIQSWDRDSGLIFMGGFDPPEQMRDLSRDAGFLALSYPVENIEDLKKRLPTVDRST